MGLGTDDMIKLQIDLIHSHYSLLNYLHTSNQTIYLHFDNAYILDIICDPPVQNQSHGSIFQNSVGVFF